MKIKSFLFENIGVRQTIFKNTLWLVAAEAITQSLKFVLIIFAARTLGVEQFGRFSFALAFASTLVIFSNFGLSSIITREFSENRENEKEYPSALSLKLILSAGALFLMILGSFFVSQDLAARKIIWILSFFVLIDDFFVVIYSFFRSRQRMEYEAWFKISHSLVVFGAVLFILLMFPSVQSVSFGYLYSSLLSLIVSLILFHFLVCPIRLDWNGKIIKKFFIMSSWLGLSAVFGTAIANVDSVMMGYYGQTVQVGMYNASKLVIIAVTIPSTWIFASFFPVLSKFFRHSAEKMEKVFNYYMGLMIALALPIMAGGIILAPKIINLLYGAEYANSVGALRALMIMAGAFFLYSCPYLLLVVSGNQKKIFWILLFGLAVNLILNMALIPKFSLHGAAGASAVTYIILFLLLTRFSMKLMPDFPFNGMILKIFLFSSAASAVMALFISLPAVYNLHVVLSVALGALAYSFFWYALYRFSSLPGELSKI